MYVCGISTVFVALKWRAFRTDALAWFTAFMVAATVLYTGHYVYFNHVVEVAPVADCAYSLSNLLVYPLFFIYLSRLAVGSPLRRRLPRPWVLLVPSFVVAAAIGALYVTMSEEDCNTFVAQWLYHGRWSGLHGLSMAQAVLHVVAKVLFALQIVPVLLVGGRMIRQHDRFVIDNYADTDGKMLASLHTLLIVLLATSVASFIANIIGRQLFVDSIWMLAIPSVVFSVLLLAVASVGLSLSNPIADDDNDEAEAVAEPVAMPVPDDKPQQPDDDVHQQPVAAPATAVEAPGEQPVQRPAPTADAAPASTVAAADARRKILDLKADIVALLRDERLFLKHDLRIADLATLLSTNRNYIQQAISGELGTTFSELVNRMRIDHAVELIKANPAMPMTEVAERSGYRSLASFYRNFKLIKGCAPKDLKA